MKESKGLHPVQYKKLYEDDDVPLIDVRGAILRKFVYIGSILALCFVVAGAIIKFPDQVQLPYLIRSSETEEVYRYDGALYLVESYVKPRDTVARGQSLLKITSPEIASLINAYDEAKQNLANYAEHKTLSIAQQKLVVETRIEGDKRKINDAQAELGTLDSTWQSNRKYLENEYLNASNSYNANSELYQKGYIAKTEMNDFEAKKLKAADALETSKQNYLKNKTNITGSVSQDSLDIESAKEELSEMGHDKAYDSVVLNNAFLLAKNKITNIFGDFDIVSGNLVLKAKDNGIVSYIFVGEKEVKGGAILAKVIYNKTSLYASAKCPPSLIGRIEKNNKVALKVSSFPFYDWGTLSGHLQNLSLTPDEDGKFSVEIAIDDFGKMNHLVQIGMDGDATIILGEHTFYGYIFNRVNRKVYKYVNT